MKNEYFDKIAKEAKEGRNLTKVEALFLREYLEAKKLDAPFITWSDGFDKGTAVEIASIMRAAKMKKLYVTGQWSNQFEALYELQYAGLYIVGMDVIKNAWHKFDMVRYGNSHRTPTLIAMVLELND